VIGISYKANVCDQAAIARADTMRCMEELGSIIGFLDAQDEAWVLV